jgi:hypothetical protein
MTSRPTLRTPASLTRRRRRVGAVALAAVAALAPVVGLALAPAAAGAGTPGARRALAQLTTAVPSQVTAAAVCPAPAPGHAQCEAQALVMRATRRPARPRVSGGPTFSQVFPSRSSRRHLAFARAAAVASAVSSAPAIPPQAGTPAYLQQAYDLTYLSQTAGGQDTVAIVDAGDDPSAESDLAVFRSTYGLPACASASGCLTKVNQRGAAAPLPPSAGSDWEEEESLDLDAVSALCPNCRILLVETDSTGWTDLSAGIAEAQSLGADQISNSWGAVMSGPVTAETFPGSSVIAAAGDDGYAGPGAAMYPAAYPTVTAAGGTTLAPTADASNLRGFDESAWSLGSSGPGWGGGSGCDLEEAKPAYQADTGCSGRSYSDVSADASPETGLNVYDAGQGGWLTMGGTSLAAPLIAAFEAVTGVDGKTPQWAYSDSALLNDPASGSTGSCAADILYICNAGVGYDGPTGGGSISGAIATGAPGVAAPAIGDGGDNGYAGAATATTVTLSGGLYPNGLDTTYWWQYGTSERYGEQTPPVDAGAGARLVAAGASLQLLAPGSLYHYRLVAHNADGTVYGYDYTFTTSPQTASPTPVSPPRISGRPWVGGTLRVTDGLWQGHPTAYAYQWQRSGDDAGAGGWSDIAGASDASYVPAAADRGGYLRVAVTASAPGGVADAPSAPVGPVTLLHVSAGAATATSFSATRLKGRQIRVRVRGHAPRGDAMLVVRVGRRVLRTRAGSLLIRKTRAGTLWAALVTPGAGRPVWVRVRVR